MTVAGPKELCITLQSVRFTDAVSNFGWAAAFSAPIA
jgi:hypothetical protein